MLPFNLPIQNVLVDNLASLHLDLPQPYLNPPTTPVLFVTMYGNRDSLALQSCQPSENTQTPVQENRYTSLWLT
ncbi:hypothetical protein F9C07_10301 [Aspergillus flavus]|uniref:Uncharacterized protein n=1 Tax=Aspergillus flavus (strain ATCC 200026 / FGSC A1120 / IAM 13836 / NRRL 3357 / JCM 12722 / SRRC 167) TaxID=332952 RepID=A0A7U2QZS5_ASPFN|nr:hypothetical protein F9C07_10301 [Aspergillus flavus]